MPTAFWWISCQGLIGELRESLIYGMELRNRNKHQPMAKWAIPIFFQETFLLARVPREVWGSFADYSTKSIITFHYLLHILVFWPFGIFIRAKPYFTLQLVKYLSVCDGRIHYLALKGFKVAIHNYHQSRLGKEFFPSCSSDEDLETHGVELQQQMKSTFMPCSYNFSVIKS